MARKPPPGRCVYCLKPSDDLTWDHVFPQSWFPDTTPANLEKWQVPGCSTCNNNKYSAIEEDLLIRLICCMSPDDLRVSGIPANVFRSVDPEAASSEKEKRIRQLKREKILREMRTVDTPPPYGVLPGFGPVAGVSYEKGCTLVNIPTHPLVEFGAKLVRGITHLAEGTFIEPENEIEVFFVHDEDAMPLIQNLRQRATLFQCGPGIEVWRVVDQADNFVFFEIYIWKKLRFFASVYERGKTGEKSYIKLV